MSQNWIVSGYCPEIEDEQEIEVTFLEIQALGQLGPSYVKGAFKKGPPPVGDGLNAEQVELIRLFEKAPSALRVAALAVLRSAEGQSKVPDGALADE